MRYLKRIVPTLFLVFVLGAGPGCALVGSPETPREILASSEITFQEVASQMISLRERGSINDETWAKARLAAETIHTSLEAYSNAIKYNLPTTAYLRVIQTGLRSLQAVVRDAAK